MRLSSYTLMIQILIVDLSSCAGNSKASYAYLCELQYNKVRSRHLLTLLPRIAYYENTIFPHQKIDNRAKQMVSHLSAQRVQRMLGVKRKGKPLLRKKRNTKIATTMKAIDGGRGRMQRMMDQSNGRL